MMALIVKNLRKSYSKINKKFILNDLSFSIDDGEIFALIGQNGAGKTTTIKCILKFINSTSGEIKINDGDITELMSKSKVGYLPEILMYPKLVTLKEYLTDLGSLRGMESNILQKKIRDLTEYLEIDKFLNKPIFKFSKGMKRKTGFIQAVLNDPEFLILDEPTDGLDPVARRKILSYIKKMADNKSMILITSHILADLESICDRVAIVDNGKVISEIQPKAYMKHKEKYKFKFNIENGNIISEKKCDLSSGDTINLCDGIKLTLLQSEIKFNSLEEWYFDTLKIKEVKQ